MQHMYLNKPDRAESIDSFRSLIIQYVACVAEGLAENRQFQRLLEELGQLARGLVVQIVMRPD
jgi:hypothetical protein